MTANMMTPPKQEKKIEPMEPQCEFRGWVAVGKIRCNCSNKPNAFVCSFPSVVSGYCTPSLPQQPGDGPIVTPEGGKITPADERYPSFLPMPLREGEIPRACDVVVCASCPHRIDTPPQIARLKRLGVIGQHDPDTGHVDIVHVVPAGIAADTVGVPAGLAQATVTAGKAVDLQEVAAATSCRMLAVYWPAVDVATVTKAVESGNCTVWLIGREWTRGPAAKGAVYDLPEDLLAAKRSLYAQACERMIAPERSTAG